MPSTTAPMSIQLEYAWQESCDAALKHFDETGLHASPDEVMAWVDSWETDKELPTPLCHP